MKYYISILLMMLFCQGIYADNQMDMHNQIDPLAHQFMQKNNIPGMAIAIYYQGEEFLFNYGYADKAQRKPVTQDTIFDLASITKIFTTTLLAVLVDQHKLSLDDPIVKYLPALASTQGLPIDNVDVIHLATHTASFPRDVMGFGVRKNDDTGLMKALNNWEPSYPVGTKYVYSNVSFGLLGRVLQTAGNKPYMELLETNILSPLNMKHTVIKLTSNDVTFHAQGYKINNTPAPLFKPTQLLGGGALRSSSADMMQFLKANLNIPTANASTELLAAMQFAQQPIFTIRPNFIMALGWQRVLRNHNLYITKNGANLGFSTFMGFSPDKKFGVVVLTNKTKGKAAVLGNKILNLLSQ